MYDIQHCFICRPSDSTVSEDAGIEPRTVATTALTVKCSNHSARSHPHLDRSHPPSARSRPLISKISYPDRICTNKSSREHCCGGTNGTVPEAGIVANANLNVVLRHLTLESLLEGENGSVNGILRHIVGIIYGF
jgi:hypothetical protein